MKSVNYLFLVVFIFLFGCFKQSNEGYLEVVNLSSDSINIFGFGKGDETISAGDTSTMYTFELGEYEHIWYTVYARGKYINEMGGRYPNVYLSYYRDVCIHDGSKTILEITDYLDECSVTIINKTTYYISYVAGPRDDLWSFLYPEETDLWDFRAPIDDVWNFTITVMEPFRFDTTVAVSGGEHLNVEILPE